MKNTRTFNYYTDPSHGWVKVPNKLIEELNLTQRISRYSYYRNGYAYLEEDCDAGVVINELRDRGVKVKFNHKPSNKSSKIRSYSRY